jgi:hypothetical protein
VVDYPSWQNNSHSKIKNSHSKKIKLPYPILKLIKLNLLIVLFILKKQNQNNINFKKI